MVDCKRSSDCKYTHVVNNWKLCINTDGYTHVHYILHTSISDFHVCDFNVSISVTMDTVSSTSLYCEILESNSMYTHI